MRTDFVKVDNFYLSDEALRLETPSRKAGVDEETEEAQRLYGAEVIQTCGICLKFPQVVMCTGQVLLQRFFCKRSLTQYDVKAVALACLWLAAKLEEVPNIERYMWKVLMVFDRVTKRMADKNLDVLELHSKKYYKMRDEVVRIEKDMLIAFGFVMHVEHPHKQVMNYLTALSRRKANEAAALSEEQEAKVNELMQRAFSLVNDSLRTTLCVRFKAEVVACAAIFMAARQLKVPLPETEEGPNWWDLFDVRLADMAEVSRTIMHLYTLPKAAYLPLTAPISKRPPTGAVPSKLKADKLPAEHDPFETPPTSAVTGMSGGPTPPPPPPLPSGKAPAVDEIPQKEVPLEGPQNGSKPPRPERAPSEHMDDRKGRHGKEQERERDRSRERERGRGRDQKERERVGSRGPVRSGGDGDRRERDRDARDHSRDRRGSERNRRPRDEREREYRRDSADRRGDAGEREKLRQGGRELPDAGEREKQRQGNRELPGDAGKREKLIQGGRELPGDAGEREKLIQGGRELPDAGEREKQRQGGRELPGAGEREKQRQGNRELPGDAGEREKQRQGNRELPGAGEREKQRQGNRELPDAGEREKLRQSNRELPDAGEREKQRQGNRELPESQQRKRDRPDREIIFQSRNSKRNR